MIFVGWVDGTPRCLCVCFYNMVLISICERFAPAASVRRDAWRRLSPAGSAGARTRTGAVAGASS